MIRVTIELFSAVDPARNRVLGTMDIANDASGSKTVGHYHGTLHAEYTHKGGRPGRVSQFNRKRQSVWSLVGAFLKLWGHTGHSPKLLHKEPYEIPAEVEADPGLDLEMPCDFSRGFFCAAAVLLMETCREGSASTEAKSLFQKGGDWRKADAYDIEIFKRHGLITDQHLQETLEES